MPLTFDDVVRRLEAAPAPRDVQAVWQDTIEALGFASFDYAFGRLTTPNPRTGLDLAPECYLSTRDWTAHYFERGFQAVDPFTAAALSRVLPFSYDGIFQADPTGPKQRELLGDIREVGIRSGLAIPLHGPGPDAAAMYLGSPLAPSEFARLDREVRPLAALLAAYFHERMKALVRPLAPKPVLSVGEEPARGARPRSAPQPFPGPVRLTGREREVLLWAARGKTAWETAAILGVAEATANNLLASAKRKLGANTRAHAVARAIVLGLIEP